jgi:secreted trypsin-like serine protease
MRSVQSIAVALLALPASVAFAEDGGKTEAPRAETHATPVIGGSAAPAGKWPDAAALLWGGQQACTGTLIAPTLVLTAGHCVEGGAPDEVLVGATAKSRPQEGQTIAVMKSIDYPNSQNSVDVGLLILAQPSTVAPRKIAGGWAKLDIQNNASIQLVGYGTTDMNGNVETDALLEAASTITDYNCSTSSGCNGAAKPDGELGAGGGGIDTCPGDSGGPLYLLTSYGNFLAGVTSRGYDSNQYYCGEGGIYGRADKVIDWIEQQSGVKLDRAPTPTADPITAVRGVGTETKITHNDPKSDAHDYAIVTQPGYGTAAVSSTGVVRVCPQKDVVGGDTVTVSVTDKNDPSRTLNLTIPVNIVDGSPDDSCDPMDFGGDGGGCCDTRRSATGWAPLALFVGLVLRRRRRAR